MATITIQIGNSDDKLTQNEWAHYVESVKLAIENAVNEVHFFGGSPNWFPWQNVAWVVVCHETKLKELRLKLTSIRQSYNNDSIAWAEGKTEFI